MRLFLLIKNRPVARGLAIFWSQWRTAFVNQSGRIQVVNKLCLHQEIMLLAIRDDNGALLPAVTISTRLPERW